MNKKQKVTISFLVLAILCTAAWIIVSLAFRVDNSLKTTQSLQRDVVSSPVVGSNVYSGEYLSVEPLSTWRIKEYTDNSGMYMKPTEPTFSGLTGFEVLKKDRIILTFYGVAGIGGEGPCSKIYKFYDTSLEYISMKVEEYRDFFNNTRNPEIVEISTYTSIELFGKNARRVGSILYFDSNPLTESFDSICNTSPYYTFDKLVFNDSDLLEFNTYRVEISNEATIEDLLELDEVINSLRYI